jgi:hypothetical protein
MHKLIRMFLGMCSIIFISTITCSGYVLIAGISGIAKGTVEGFKTAADNGATFDQLRQQAQANGFELSVR